MSSRKSRYPHPGGRRPPERRNTARNPLWTVRARGSPQWIRPPRHEPMRGRPATHRDIHRQSVTTRSFRHRTATTIGRPHNAITGPPVRRDFRPETLCALSRQSPARATRSRRAPSRTRDRAEDHIGASTSVHSTASCRFGSRLRQIRADLASRLRITLMSRYGQLERTVHSGYKRHPMTASGREWSI